MKPITSYKELLASFLEQIKESEVTDERIIVLNKYIENDLVLTDYYESKIQPMMTYEVFANLDENKHLARTAT
jgi:hypothetical protein